MILHAVGSSEGGFQFTSQSGMGCTFASDVASRINRLTRSKEGEGSRVAIDHVCNGQGGGSLQESSEETCCLQVYEELQKL